MILNLFKNLYIFIKSTFFSIYYLTTVFGSFFFFVYILYLFYYSDMFSNRTSILHKRAFVVAKKQPLNSINVWNEQMSINDIFTNDLVKTSKSKFLMPFINFKMIFVAFLIGYFSICFYNIQETAFYFNWGYDEKNVTNLINDPFIEILNDNHFNYNIRNFELLSSRYDFNEFFNDKKILVRAGTYPSRLSLWFSNNISTSNFNNINNLLNDNQNILQVVKNKMPFDGVNSKFYNTYSDISINKQIKLPSLGLVNGTANLINPEFLGLIDHNYNENMYTLSQNIITKRNAYFNDNIGHFVADFTQTWSPFQYVLNDNLIIVWTESFNLYGLDVMFCFINIYLILFLLNKDSYSLNSNKLIPNLYQYISEMLYKVSLGLFVSNIGKQIEEKAFFIKVNTILIFILISNVQGMIPYMSTLTSSLMNTFFVALALFISILITIFIEKGWRYFLCLFMPSGCPIGLIFLLIPIEIISYTFRVVSLSVRLFANMMAGHTLLKVIVGFSWEMILAGEIFLIINFVPVITLFILTVLEIGVAFIQTYIFTILACIYLKDIFFGH